MNKEELLQNIKWNEKGLVTVIAQDFHAKKVRMVAYMNEEALNKTLETGKVHYYSRSRQELWLKGETSGQYQYVKGLSIDCDGDAILLQIEQVTGISCHTGHATCFYRAYDDLNGTQDLNEISQTDLEELNDQSNSSAFAELSQVIEERKRCPKAGSYTNYLLEKGTNKILKKVGEECTEVIIAAKEEQSEELVFELADLIYHLTVLMHTKQISWQKVETELKKRK